jgi:hypothetical protein
VEWPATQDLAAPITVRYRTVEADSAVDVTFDVVAQVDMARFELFISSYFTPYYTPRYAVRDRRLDPEALVWYEKRWYAEAEDECWARDEGAEAVFADGRWSTGYPLNWQMGAPYAHPLMIQEHRYGHAIVTMARLRDCIGISGLNSYHNAQYFHLFGRDVKSGERLSTQVRMVLWTQWQDLQQEALECYGRWMEEN